jgi:hypothetical protein
MRRIARITEDLGTDGGGFYVDPPDIPDGVTCHEWRRLRFEIRDRQTSTSKPPAPDWRALVPRPTAFRVPTLRTALS